VSCLPMIVAKRFSEAKLQHLAWRCLVISFTDATCRETAVGLTLGEEHNGLVAKCETGERPTQTEASFAALEHAQGVRGCIPSEAGRRPAVTIGIRSGHR